VKTVVSRQQVIVDFHVAGGIDGRFETLHQIDLRGLAGSSVSGRCCPA